VNYRSGRPPGQFQQKAEDLLGLLIVDLHQRRLDSHPEPNRYWAERMGVSAKQAGSYIRHLREQGRIDVKTTRVNLGPGTWANKRSITPKEAQ
jgi:hypothetical protein